MNLNDLYRPIGRLYEEVPSANYFGDYSAANGGWNNAIEDDPAIKSMIDEIAALNRQKQSYQVELNDITTGTQNCSYQAANPIIAARRGYNCPNLLKQYGSFPVTIKGKTVTFVLYDAFQNLGNRIKNTLPNAIAEIDKQIKKKQAELEVQISLKGKSTQASQETTTETLRLKGIQDKAKSESESKQKQTDAELRAKKIFLSIIASGLILSVASWAIFKR